MLHCHLVELSLVVLLIYNSELFETEFQHQSQYIHMLKEAGSDKYKIGNAFCHRAALLVEIYESIVLSTGSSKQQC